MQKIEEEIKEEEDDVTESIENQNTLLYYILLMLEFSFIKGKEKEWEKFLKERDEEIENQSSSKDKH